MSRLLRIAASVGISLALCATVRAQTYKEVTRFKLAEGPAVAIAVDTPGRRLFVASGSHVEVLNADTGSVQGSISGLRGASDVLLVPEMQDDKPAASTRGFASDDAGDVIGFAVGDLKASSSVRLQSPGATSLCYDLEHKTLEAVSAGGAIATIDPMTGKVIAAAKIHTGSGQIACGNIDHVYVADPEANVVHVLNHATMRNEGDYPMKSGHKPTGLALDTKGRRLFVTCEDGTIEIIDTDSGFTFIQLKGGAGVAHETFAWLPQGKGQWKAAAFVAQADGTLSAVRMNAFINYSLGGQYKLAPGLGAIAYDDQSHHLFITSMVSGSPVVVVAGY